MDTRHMLGRYGSLRTQLVLEGLLVGVCAGLVSVLYRYALACADQIRNTALSLSAGNPLRMAGWFLILILLALLVTWLLKWEPMISGSGIPQVEAEIAGYLRPSWYRVIAGKIVGGFLCIVGGLSLGREGPSIQLGGMMGKGISKGLKRFRLEEHFLITCGASAGLSAAFNAPLAGVMFALEEVHKSFSPLVLLSCMAASLVANYISSGIFGMQPVFSFPVNDMIPLSGYAYIVVLGLICGFLGVFYNKILLLSQTAYKKIAFLPQAVRMMIPFVCAGVLGFVMPEVLGGGHEMIAALYHENLALTAILVLLAGKFIYSMVSFGSGAPGGIFFPLLVLGAYIGGAYSTVAVDLFGFDHDLVANLIIIAMAALFSAIVRAPVTGIVLISEMTGSFSHLMSLATASLVAYITAEMLRSKPVYESLTERLLAGRNVKIAKGNAGKKSIITSIIEEGSAADGCTIRELGLPEDTLVISVTRGEDELIPRGNLRLKAGDTLATMVRERDLAAMESVLRHKISFEEE
ncbi:MAG: chloride channel protein [Eubacteriales bacterium]|nr:chloride channel protein [Eubacteriales bacterium]